MLNTRVMIAPAQRHFWNDKFTIIDAATTTVDSFPTLLSLVQRLDSIFAPNVVFNRQLDQMDKILLLPGGLQKEFCTRIIDAGLKYHPDNEEKRNIAIVDQLSRALDQYKTVLSVAEFLDKAEKASQRDADIVSFLGDHARSQVSNFPFIPLSVPDPTESPCDTSAAASASDIIELSDTLPILRNVQALHNASKASEFRG